MLLVQESVCHTSPGAATPSVRFPSLPAGFAPRATGTGTDWLSSSWQGHGARQGPHEAFDCAEGHCVWPLLPAGHAGLSFTSPCPRAGCALCKVLLALGLTSVGRQFLSMTPGYSHALQCQVSVVSWGQATGLKPHDTAVPWLVEPLCSVTRSPPRETSSSLLLIPEPLGSFFHLREHVAGESS